MIIIRTYQELYHYIGLGYEIEYESGATTIIGYVWL